MTQSFATVILMMLDRKEYFWMWVPIAGTLFESFTIVGSNPRTVTIASGSLAFLTTIPWIGE